MIAENELEKIIFLLKNNYYCIDQGKLLNVISDLKKIKGRNISCEKVDKCLCQLNDLHLRLYYKRYPRKMNFIPIEYIDNKLYICEQNKLHRIVSINNRSIEDICDIISNDYAFRHKGVVMQQIVQDAKLCRGFFDREKLNVKIRENKEYEYYSEKIDVVLKKMKNTPLKEAISPIIWEKIDNDTVLIKIIFFQKKEIEKMFLEIINQIKEKNIKNIIIDLRDNQGGFVNVAKTITSYIIPCDVRFDYELRNKDGHREDNKIVSKQLPFFYNKNIYVFINNNTMSVSEYIVASGIKLAFAEKKILFGEKTFGMSGQARIYQINENVQLYMTEKRYMLAGGKKEIKEGIEPDYPINYSGEDITKEDYFVKWYKNNKDKL